MGDDSKGTGWMYNPVSEINREDYLLGKKIGKDFDAEGTMGKINDVEYDCTPASIFSSQAGHQVDIQRKLLEDPLVSIKKREAEDRKKVLDNPIKMKALNEHIAAMKKSQKKKKKKKKKKGSDSESDEDLDLKLLKRIQRMEQGGGGSEEEKESEEETKKKKKKHKNKENRRERSRSRSPQRRQRSVSRSPDRRRRRRSPSNSPPRRRRSPSNSPPRRRRSPSNSPPRRRRRSRSESPPRRRRSPSSSPPRRRRRSPSKSPPRKRKSPSESPPRRRNNRSRSSSPQPPRKKAGLDLLGKVKTENGQSDRKSSPPPSSKPSAQVARKKPMTDEEKQARLAEMMANADWRDEQRTARVMKHRREQEKEVEEHEGGEHDTNFINRELQRAQGSLTVEGRLTANKYKLQRGHGAMDQNFAKR